MKRLRFSPRSSFARTLLLIVTLLFVSLVTTYLVVLNFAILPSLQQFNKVLAYEVRMLMTDRLQLEDGTQLEVPPAFRREIYRELGIPTIASVRWTVHQIHRMLLHRHLSPELGFGNGETLLVRSEVPDYLIGRRLAEFDVDGEIRVIEVTRGGRSLIPSQT